MGGLAQKRTGRFVYIVDKGAVSLRKPGEKIEK
jgi:hypothetical protein